QLSTLEGLGDLPQLQSLDCSFNQLSTLEGLGDLPQLQSLDGRANQLNTLEGLRDLPQLQRLNCSTNQITKIPLLIQQRVLDKKLTELKLYSNLIHHIPSVIFGEDTYDDCCESLINYWQALEQGSTRIQQLKVQLLGNGRVGKTTLAYALEHKKAPPENFASTHGIALKEIPFQLEGQNQPVTLQLWDFGGQEIYHATHRLFLSKDCLYLLLWAEETDESQDEINHPVSYWLELINDLGGDSPVILVKNQIDRSDKLPERPEGLNNDLPGAKQIRDALKISAMKHQRMHSLRGAIASIIEELQPRICLELPNSWLAVQAELDVLRSQQQRTLPFNEFEKLCEQVGIEDARWFADYLHQIGFIFYQADSFQNKLVLDQNWAIEAIYKLFDRNKNIRRRIEKAQGRISGDEFEEFWKDETENEHQIYASFMLNCGVCYEIDWVREKLFKDREFIIPALLPEKSPLCESWGAERAEDWLLEVQYPFLHRSIIERLISELDQKYCGTAWQYGIFCTTSDGQVLFQTQLQKTKTSNKGSLLFKLRGQQLERLLYELRRLISEASPHKRYQELLTRNGKTEHLSEFQKEYHMTEPTPVEAKKVKIFISYSHLDEAHKKELDKHLKALGHLFAIEAWNDRQLIAGDGVDKTIFEKLNAADVVLLLISPDFMASDYCFKKEMQSALQAYKENKNTVIPIIIRNTPTWFKHEIGQIVALPTDGKHLSKWDDPDDFWADVEMEIAKRVEHLLT
ncbi:COR domain-containing protein, partial [uncultured Thiothrix sp.]|uniref:COR domain-containing protein n=1 Tax=uncultured Thiothrix sp. TaxID=223185 RepID=UPI00261FE296